MLRKNGDFVVRVTELQGCVTEASLSVFWNGIVHYFLLLPNTAKTYQICAPASAEKLPIFENVSSMVQFYLKSETPFGQHKIVLKKPVRRQLSFHYCVEDLYLSTSLRNGNCVMMKSPANSNSNLEHSAKTSPVN